MSATETLSMRHGSVRNQPQQTNPRTSEPFANMRLLDALARRATDRPPIWIMRQAGRYLPEYRRVREQAGSFLNLCKTPELACQVSLQPVERYALDAAIIFSDILTIPDAMGLGLGFKDNEGPFFERPLQTRTQIDALQLPEPEALEYVAQAIRLVCQALDRRVPLIGFSGSPWTLASYMVEGHGRHQFCTVKTMMFNSPELFSKLLNLLAVAAGNYLAMQAKAGCACVMIFDSWGGVLSTEQYLKFSLAPMRKTMQVLAQQVADVPVIVFTKGGGAWLEQIAACGCAALGLDWTVHLGEAKARVGAQVALQGNLDPATLLACDSALRSEVRRTLDEFGRDGGHIFNLGHGIYPTTDPTKVQVLIEAVHDYFPSRREKHRC